MPAKPLYQQAVEVYQLQKALIAYDVGNDNIFLKWYHSLSVQDQRVLHESAHIVARFAEELTKALSEALSELLQPSELPQKVLDKFFPSTLLNELNIDVPDCAVEVPNESDDYATIGVDSDEIPDDTDEFDREEKNLLEQALKMYLPQQLLGTDSFNEWFGSLSAEDKRILQESLQSALAITDDITRSFSDVVHNIIQLTKEHIEKQFLPIQELCEQ